MLKIKKCDNRMEVKLTTNVFDNIYTMYLGMYMQVSTIAELKICWNLVPPSLNLSEENLYLWNCLHIKTHLICNLNVSGTNRIEAFKLIFWKRFLGHHAESHMWLML